MTVTVSKDLVCFMLACSTSKEDCSNLSITDIVEFELNVGGSYAMPFMRTDAVLSPTHAQDIPNVSREATHVALAREAYHKSMQPAQYGVHMQNIKDMNPAATGGTESNNTTSLQQQHAKVCY